jgi:alkaline phosphatase
MMVEAGRIDHAHHGSNAYRALKDLQALDEAVAAAVEKAGEDTLILVTADHSHVFTIAGYPARGNPILGLVRSVDRETGGPADEYLLDEDGKPYTTLGYHNGPNVREADSETLTDNMVQAPDYRQQTAVRLGSETHAGEDVALYATGPGAARFNGVMEQDEIGQILADLLAE